MQPTPFQLQGSIKRYSRFKAAVCITMRTRAEQFTRLKVKTCCMLVWSEWDVLKCPAPFKISLKHFCRHFPFWLLQPQFKQFNHNNIDQLYLTVYIKVKVVFVESGVCTVWQIYFVDYGYILQLWANMCWLLDSRPSIFLLSPIVSFSLRASTEQLGRGSWGPGVGPGRLLKYLIFRAWRTTDNSINMSSLGDGQEMCTCTCF